MSAAVRRNVVVTRIARADREIVDDLVKLGVSSIHEAQGRTHLLDPACAPSTRPRGSRGRR